MTGPTTPNWLRIVILVLSLISFVPQIRLLALRRNSSGISPYYVLFNLISATEQFAISFYLIVDRMEPPPDAFTHDPLQVGDWLNLAQVTLVWGLWLFVFALCMLFPSDHDHTGHRMAVFAVYVSFLLISVVPVFIDVLSRPHNDPHHWWADALYHGIHSMFINPVITILCLAALPVQASETLSRRDPASLSLIGLVVQAVVFAFAAIAWVWRLVFPWDWHQGHISFGIFTTWYQLVGWVAVDNAVFAVVQAVLFWLAIRHRSGYLKVAGAETEPLLRH